MLPWNLAGNLKIVGKFVEHDPFKFRIIHKNESGIEQRWFQFGFIPDQPILPVLLGLLGSFLRGDVKVRLCLGTFLLKQHSLHPVAFFGKLLHSLV